MCSIFGVFDIHSYSRDLREQALRLSRLMRHRGPDWSGIYQNDRVVLAHERLSIVDVDKGGQPLVNELAGATGDAPTPAIAANAKHILVANGEIYNHQMLRLALGNAFAFQTDSDCEVILALYAKYGEGFIDQLNGMFAFALYNETQDSYLIARDHIGIIPLYSGRDAQDNLYIASELKALEPVCADIEAFPPGHYLASGEGEIKPYYRRPWRRYAQVRNNNTDIEQLRCALEQAVKSHLMADVPYGVLLSGGLDSSLVSAIAKKYSSNLGQGSAQDKAWSPSLHSFAIGLQGSPDLAAAQSVADAIRTVHHEFHFTIQEGLDSLSDVIYHIESYDVTSVRSAIPTYLLARKIKSMGIKVVLSGEGADEVFAGYLYFHRAPNARELHEETVRKLDRLNMYDCRRLNKAMAAWGVEARVPYLDKAFLDVAMSINPKDKLCGNGKIEKSLLRQAFAGYIPDEVLWRQKEQFCDGVGYSWLEGLSDHAEREVSDQDMRNAARDFPVNTPLNKESYLYRRLFEQHFPSPAAVRSVPWGKSVACSTAEALAWDQAFLHNADPSGRSMRTIHQPTTAMVTEQHALVEQAGR